MTSFKLKANVKTREDGTVPNPRRVEIQLYARQGSRLEWYAVTDLNVTEVENWVNENKFGKRVSYNNWDLVSDQAVTMFLLKWNQ